MMTDRRATSSEFAGARSLCPKVQGRFTSWRHESFVECYVKHEPSEECSKQSHDGPSAGSCLWLLFAVSPLLCDCISDAWETLFFRDTCFIIQGFVESTESCVLANLTGGSRRKQSLGTTLGAH